MATETTSQGVRKHYGPRDTEKKAPSRPVTSGEVKEHVVEFAYDSLPEASELDNLVTVIPANAFILSSHLYVSEAWVGGTSLTIGLAEPDGTAIDADGFDAAVLTAALTDNAWIVNDGDLVGDTVGTTAGQVVATVAGTYTAGAAKLVVRYLEP